MKSKQQKHFNLSARIPHDTAMAKMAELKEPGHAELTSHNGRDKTEDQSFGSVEMLVNKQPKSR